MSSAGPLVLVTGASGFVGTHLVRALVETGVPVRALVRSASHLDALEGLPVELVGGDLEHPESFPPAVEGVEVVYHCAAKVGEAGRLSDYRRANVRGTMYLARAAKAAGAKRFVYLSSGTVLGMVDHVGTTEDAPYLPSGDPYADSKIEAERALLDYCRRSGLAYVILRPSIVYGPGDRYILPGLVRGLLRRRIFLINEGRGVLPCCYIENLVPVIVAAGRRPQALGQVYNLTDARRITCREFVGTLAEILDVPAPEFSLPYPAARALCAVAETAHRLSRDTSPPRFSKGALRFLGLSREFDVSKAVRDLDLTCRVELREALARSVEWMRASGLLARVRADSSEGARPFSVAERAFIAGAKALAGRR